MTPLRFEWTRDSSLTFHAACNRHSISAVTHDVRGWATVHVADGAVQLLPTPVGWIECDIASLHSSNRLEDFEMRRQIQAKNFPTMRYDLREVSPASDGYSVSGDLTFHGVTRPVTEICAVLFTGTELRITAAHSFDVREFGVEPPQILRLFVQPEVQIDLELIGSHGTRAKVRV